VGDTVAAGGTVAVGAVGDAPGTVAELELVEVVDVGAGVVPGADVPPHPAASRATTASDRVPLSLMAHLSFGGARRARTRTTS